ncbi:MAG: cupredoxin family protein [Gammaproteobacteria bacterium]|nr:cupredoxin family protein [Gammaproteobacteria bacterium]MDE1887320.1 cupredoxin family protein [Gammaproteobacteria bacterium]MDE2140647.1 cupredoxin family protein [Gammaproteobacteria bacterium]
MFKSSAWSAIVLIAITAPAMAMSPGGGEHFPFGHPGRGSGPVHVIHIRALDTLRFDPSRIVVTRGETVKFVVTNAGKLAHEFVIGDAAEQAAHEKEMQAAPGMSMQHDVNGISLPPGQTRDLVWTFTRDGVVEYACHIPGHFAAGMVGKIYIEPPGRHG